MVRLSYRYEMRAAMTFPLAASLAEGSFTSVVAAKNFDASITLMSVIFAAPMFVNIVAMMWSQLSLGRRKVPLVNLLQLGVVVMVASVALDALLPTKIAGSAVATGSFSPPFGTWSGSVTTGLSGCCGGSTGCVGTPGSGGSPGGATGGTGCGGVTLIGGSLSRSWSFPGGSSGFG